MKKVCVWFLLLLFLLPVVAMAEQLAEVAVEVVASEIPTNPVTWEQLATIGGAAMATMLIVQLLKLPLDKVWKIPTRIIVFLIAAIVLTLATYFTNGLTWNTALLTVINAVIVALTAMGGYELTFKKLEEKKKTEN
jgi:hypothetical protein